MNTVALRTQYVNRLTEGVQPSHTKLMAHTRWVNVGTVVIYILTLATYIVVVVKYSDLIREPNHKFRADKFNKNLVVIMAVSMIAIPAGTWTSFIFMRRMLMNSVIMRGS